MSTLRRILRSKLGLALVLSNYTCRCRGIELCTKHCSIGETNCKIWSMSSKSKQIRFNRTTSSSSWWLTSSEKRENRTKRLEILERKKSNSKHLRKLWSSISLVGSLINRKASLTRPWSKSLGSRLCLRMEPMKTLKMWKINLREERDQAFSDRQPQ